MPGIEAAGVATDLPLDMSISETATFPEGWTRDWAWPGEDPLGRRLRWGAADAQPRVVVGVVADVKNQMLMERTKPMVYLPALQSYRPEFQVIARSPAGSDRSADVLRTVLRDMDPALSTTPAQSLAQYNALALLPQRIAAAAAVAFGVLALLLSTIGVYGVIASMVARRTREIGVRMAIGADRSAVVRLVVWSGLRLALPGALIGGLAGVGLGFLLRSFILGVAPADPVAVTGTPLVLLLAVLLACWVPAARAAAIEPVQALRSE